MTKEFYPKPRRNRQKEINTLNRKDMTLWIEITTGQNNLNYVQSKIYCISPECRFCLEEDETFYHLLTECPCFQDTRSNIILTRNGTIEDWTIKQILQFAKLPQIQTALSFDTNDSE